MNISQKLSLEEQIRLHKDISEKIEELEVQKKELGVAIMQQMLTPILQVPGYRVKRCHRLSIAVSVDNARTLNAIKLEEVVDKDKIKELYRLGNPIEGVTEVNYIQISKIPHSD